MREAAKELGRGVQSCKRKWAALEAQWREEDKQPVTQAQPSPGGVAAASGQKRLWTASENLRLCLMRRRGSSYKDIGEAVNHPWMACEHQWRRVNDRTMAELEREAEEEEGEEPRREAVVG
jgi:hypothetical protein